MDRRGLIIALFMVFMGCELEERPAPPLRVTPPSGNGTVGPDGGVQRTLFRPLGTLRYGDRASAVIQPDTLMGYVFHGTAGDVPALDLALEGEGVAALAVYGPQSSTGRWGDALASAHRATRIELAPGVLPGTGAYFVLIRSLDGAAPNYTLSLSCEDCGEPECADHEPCDLYCPGGRQESDDQSCFLCECVETETAICAADDECGDGESCLGGRCVDAISACVRANNCGDRRMEVCGADGNVYHNGCWAQCHGVEFTAGPCVCAGDMDCPGGHRCLEGRCRPPDCSHCEGEDEAPVCGRRGTHFNRCFLDCYGDPFVHPGRCVRERCEGDEDCLDHQRCLPYRDGDIPGNSQACQEAPEGPSCIRRCVGRPPVQPTMCEVAGDCANNTETCYPVGADTRVCVRMCRLGGMDRSGCPMRTTCAAVNWTDAEAGRGLCLPVCGLCREDARVECLPDLRGAEVCQSCNCDVLPDDPVCAGPTQYRNACEALCDEQVRLDPCPGVMPEPAPACGCAPEWAPLCADGEIFANPCEARCAERQENLGRFAQCLQPDALRDVMRCTGDDECQTRVCGGKLCGTRAFEECDIRLSPMANCISRTSDCGCTGGQCGFKPSDNTAQCGEMVNGVGNRPQRP